MLDRGILIFISFPTLILKRISEKWKQHAKFVVKSGLLGLILAKGSALICFTLERINLKSEGGKAIWGLSHNWSYIKLGFSPKIISLHVNNYQNHR